MTTPAPNDDLVRELNVLATSLCVDDTKKATLVYDAISALEAQNDEVQTLRAALNEALAERNEAEASAMKWFECHLMHRTALDALGQANAELFKRASEVNPPIRGAR